MIGAAAAIRGAATIALAKPHLADRLARAILGVRRAVYEREECHNVAIGHAIESLERFFEGIADKKAVVEFVRAQRENPRPATRRKALRFLGKHASVVRPNCGVYDCAGNRSLTFAARFDLLGFAEPRTSESGRPGVQDTAHSACRTTLV
jgi:hypothetical protein